MNTKIFFAVSVLAVVACNDGNNSNAPTGQDSTQAINQMDSIKHGDTTANTSATGAFNIEDIAISEKELGEIPFFSLPKGIVFSDNPVKRDFDKLFFPLNGVMTPLEGKVFKSYLRTASGKYEDWSYALVEKNFDDAIQAAGGVKLSNTRLSQEEADKFRGMAVYLGEEGSLDYWNDPAHVYVIRRKDGENIYIQWSGNSAGGSFQVLQQKAVSKDAAPATHSDSTSPRKIVE